MLDNGIPVISVSNRAVVASGLVTTVLYKVFFSFLCLPQTEHHVSAKRMKNF